MSEYRGHPLKPFESPFNDVAEHLGKSFEVLRPLTDEEKDTEKVGDMYRIRFFDGIEIDAWPEEIFADESFQLDITKLSAGDFLDDIIGET